MEELHHTENKRNAPSDLYRNKSCARVSYRPVNTGRANHISEAVVYKSIVPQAAQVAVTRRACSLGVLTQWGVVLVS